MVLARLGLVLAVYAGLVAAPAAAQEPVIPDPDSPVVDAIVAIEAEILVLVELDAFDVVPPELETVHGTWEEYADGFTRDGLLQWLYEVDASGERALDALAAGGARPAAVHTALGAIGSADRVVLEAGGTIDIAPSAYVAALTILQTMLGVDADAATDGSSGTALAPVRPTRAPTPLERGAGSDEAQLEPASSADYPWASVSLTLTGVMLVGAVMVLTGRRRRREDAGAAVFDHLIGTNRRLAGASDRREITEIAVADAATLGRARLVAFIDVRSDGLALAHETAAFVDDRHLEAGMLADVAASGQTMRLVANREPALRALPAALLAVPTIATDEVKGILLLARPEDAPFTPREQELIGGLGPIVGAALANAEATCDVVESPGVARRADSGDLRLGGELVATPREA
jgi:hypothetical protein